MKKLCLLFCIIVIILSGCSDSSITGTPAQSPSAPHTPAASTPVPTSAQTEEPSSNTEPPSAEDEDGNGNMPLDPLTAVWKPFDDINTMFRTQDGSYAYSFEEKQYNRDDIATYSFDDTTVFKGSEELAADILERGKNPGLGIRELHDQGITGKGVNIAIIDQNMLTDHPEFADRIVAYYDSGCDEPEDSGSYHGASVTSVLAGKSVGVAPGVNIYYAAAPSWFMDSAYYADCLNWIIEHNKALPDDEKIRLVSVSSAPQDGWYINGEMWTEAVKAAEEDGILVIDCRSSDENTGFVFSAYYDPADPDNVQKCRLGYPNNEWDNSFNEYYTEQVFAPASYRTLAQEFMKGVYRYRYDGVGGQSWAVPYVAGVLALGWQVNPELSAGTMKELLFDSCWVNDAGMRIINPPAFIENVQNSLNN